MRASIDDQNLIDSISSGFDYNSLFITHIPEDEVTAGMDPEQKREFKKLSDEQISQMLTINYADVAEISGAFLNSLAEIGRIFTNLVRLDET